MIIYLKCGQWDINYIKIQKHGYFFCESESLTDKDFDGLIEKEDSFQLRQIRKIQ